MSCSGTALFPLSMLDDDAWDDLLRFIEERRVIPIIGPELLMVATETARERRGTGNNLDQLEIDNEWTLVGLALTAQKHDAEARDVMEPVVKRRHDVQSRNHSDNDVQLAYASALYVQAMADPAHRSALLKESTALMNSLTPDFRKLLYVQTWRQRLDASR